MTTPTDSADASCGELSCDECNARTAELTAERDQLRAEVKSCGELSCDECNARTATLTAERDQLRARAKRAEADLVALEQSFDANCRGVVKIADELATERARLDWLESPAGMDWQWQAGITRATIDAKMQKDAK